MMVPAHAVWLERVGCAVAASRQHALAYAVCLLACYALKRHYAAAGPDELRWILAPTAWLVSLGAGSGFEFESGAGYVSRELRLVLAPSCAGVNFLIVAFATSILAHTRHMRDATERVCLFACAAVAAYATTLAANSIRVLVALATDVWTSESLHRTQGTLVYVSVLFLVAARSDRSTRPGQETHDAI